jgi:hypothetical protein
VPPSPKPAAPSRCCLREKEHVRALFSLALDGPMNDSATWWSDLARKGRTAFEAEAESFLEAWINLRQVAADHD